MTQTRNPKQYDLEDRTLKYAKQIISFVSLLPQTTANVEIKKQLIRSGSSVGANYIKANESLSKKDFSMRIKICRKEAKESIYWLKLIEVSSDDYEELRRQLIQESNELMKIFGSILQKAK
jgi:four helix bundle protein